MNVKNTDKESNDLFGEYQAVDAKIGEKTRFLLPDIKNIVELSYENILLLSIGFVMVSIILFSLGVEKGRCDMLRVIKQEAAFKSNNVTNRPKNNLKNSAIKNQGGNTYVASPEPKNIKSR